jgi:glycosyltransferase involved in cell wall biosynthesis
MDGPTGETQRFGICFLQGCEAPAHAFDRESSRPVTDLEIIIPAFNEATRLVASLRKTISFLEAQPWRSRLVVVDNGSADETAAVARAVTSEQVELAVIGCAWPGKGATVRRGLLAGRAPFIGFFDADLSTPVSTLVRTMEERGLARAGAGWRGRGGVIASRRAPGGRFTQPQPLGRRAGGSAFRALARPLVPTIHDTQCGFKFFQRETVQAAARRCQLDGFAFDVELLRHVQASGGRIVELPVEWHDDRRSTFNPVRDGVASFAAVFQLYRMAVTL